MGYLDPSSLAGVQETHYLNVDEGYFLQVQHDGSCSTFKLLV